MSLWDSILEYQDPGTLGSVTREDVERYKDYLIDERKNAHRTVNDVLSRLTTAYTWAQKNTEYSGGNPFADSRRLPVDKKVHRFFTKKEIDSLLRAAYESSDDIYLFCVLAVYAGLRTKEAGNCRWEWFNWRQGSLTVQPGDGFSTKNREVRTIPIHDDLREILRPYKEKEGYLILPEKLVRGKWRVRYEPRTAFATAKEKAKVDWASPHTLRHTFASHLVSNGVSLYKVSRWLGHKDLATTQIYAHLAPADDDINRM